MGRIFDKDTGQPISNAVVTLLNGLDIEETNNSGFFEVFSSTRPFQEPTIMVTKVGYKPFYIKISESGEETSYTIKSESISVDYEEPVYPDPGNKGTFVTGTWIEKWSKEFRTGDTLSIYLAREEMGQKLKNIKER